jgi:hypothetical protein
MHISCIASTKDIEPIGLCHDIISLSGKGKQVGPQIDPFVTQAELLSDVLAVKIDSVG